MPKKRDFILIGVLLIIALAGLAVTRLLQHQSGASVTITVGGEVYGTYPLNQSREIEISDDKGYNKVVIENGSVHMEDADCPDQYCVQHAAGVISSDTAINIDTMISTMETAMESMEIGELVILALETMLVSLCMKIISVLITVILYGRMIEIYLYSSVGAIPFATMSNREWGQIGNNYLRGLFALAFQGFFMMVCVGIYAVLVANIQMSDNVHSALFGVMAYTVILCFSLMKTGNFAKSVFNAH